MRKVKGCAPLAAPAGLNAGIAAADLVVRFESSEEAVTAISDVTRYLAEMPTTPGPRISARSRAAVQRWQVSPEESVASAARELARRLPAIDESTGASPESTIPETE